MCRCQKLSFILGLFLSINACLTQGAYVQVRELQIDGTVLVNELVPKSGSVWDYAYLTWSGVQSDGQVTICLPVQWDLFTDSGLGKLQEDRASLVNTNCKTLVFNTSDGQALIESHSPIRLKQDSKLFFSSRFQGTVALNGFQLKSEKNAYYSLPSGEEAEGEFALSSGGGAGGAFDPFDFKKKSFGHGFLSGSEFHFVLLPFGLGQFASAKNVVTIEIRTDEGEVVSYTLSNQEVEALKKAGTLLNAHQLLGYLNRRNKALKGWWGLEDELQRILSRAQDESDATDEQSYIRNLIKEAEDFGIRLSTERSDTISVPGIIQAVMDSSSGESGLRQRSGQSSKASAEQTGPFSNKDRGQRSARQFDDNPKPPSVTSDNDYLGIENLDLRQILERSTFKDSCSNNTQIFIAGLYAFGQITFEEMRSLSRFNVLTDYDSLIDLLSEKQNQEKIRTLSVIRFLELDMYPGGTTLSHGISTNTPEVWKEKVKTTPELIESSALDEADRLNRYLAFSFRSITHIRTYNDLARKNIIQRESLKRCSDNLPLLSVLVELYSQPVDKYSSSVSAVQTTGININIIPKLMSLLSLPFATEEFYQCIPSDIVETENELNGENIKTKVNKILEGKGFNDYTLAALELDDQARKKIVQHADRNENYQLDEYLKDLSNKVQNNLTLMATAHEALVLFGYSNAAIKMLVNEGYLNLERAVFFAASFDSEKAGAVTQKVEQCLISFNAVLKLKRVDFPELKGGIKTNEQWCTEDQLVQAQEEVRQRSMEAMSTRQATAIADDSFNHKVRNIVWPTEMDSELTEMVKQKISPSNGYIYLPTEDEMLLGVVNALKLVINNEARSRLNKLWKRQRRIDSGEESFCEKVMRWIFG